MPNYWKAIVAYLRLFYDATTPAIQTPPRMKIHLQATTVVVWSDTINGIVFLSLRSEWPVDLSH
jgi:hypothetical protein